MVSGMGTDARREKADYFHRMAQGWDERVGNNGRRRELLGRVFGMMRIPAGARVLDVGCGSGVLFPFIEKKVGPEGKIVAVDPAEGMIEQARAAAVDFTNIECRAGFIEEMNFPTGMFDTILCYAVLPHMDDIPGALGVLFRALAPGCILYIFHPDDTRTLNEFHSGLNAPVKHDLLPEEAALRALLEGAGFRVLRYIDEPGLNFTECVK